MDDANVILLQRQIDGLKDQFSAHQASEDDRWSHLLAMTEQNTEAAKQNAVAAKQNAESIAALTKSTAGLLDAWNTAVGVKKAGTALGSFIKWIGSLGILGAAIMWIAEKLHG